MITSNSLVINSLYPTPVNDPLDDIKAEVGRLIHAAIINRQFCKKLLNNPSLSIEMGYQGESFNIPQQYKERIQNIRARDLEEFSSLAMQAIKASAIPEMAVLQCQS